jgi:hypothetical protein
LVEASGYNLPVICTPEEVMENDDAKRGHKTGKTGTGYS